MRTMTPGWRKLALIVHITASVGWFGAAGAYVVIAVIALTTDDVSTLRVAFPLMEKMVWYAILPFNFASLLSGLVSSLGSTWGLFRHVWVVIKLVLNVITTLVLLIYVREIGMLADIAGHATLTAADRNHLADPTNVVHAGVGMVILFSATVLAVAKPRGTTRYGRRKKLEERQTSATRRRATAT